MPQTSPYRNGALVALMALFASGMAAHAEPAKRVSLNRHTFNPSHGEAVAITVITPSESRISVAVLDRDGHVTRSLAKDQPASGAYTATWNGRDDAGGIVADEAYSFKIDVVSSGDRWSYFPGAGVPKSYPVQAKRYSRSNAALMYELPGPARIHAQAGSATIDQKTKAYDGPVLKTLVNREPRAAGAIVESWNGLDESGRIYVPDLPHFVTAILATELPENSVIAFGNRGRSFLDVAAGRRGTSLLPASKLHSHEHHHGLATLEDVSPSLVITPLNATWNEYQKAWVVAGDALSVELRLAGPTAANVARQPGKIISFLDYSQQSERPFRVSSRPMTSRVSVPAGGARIVTINWQSDYGPLAANSLRVMRAIEPAEGARATSR